MVNVWRVKTRWTLEFVRVEADKVTASSVFIGGRRVLKISDGIRYFEDFDSARDYAVRYLQGEIDRLQRDLDKAQQSLVRVENVKDEALPVSKHFW